MASRTPAARAADQRSVPAEQRAIGSRRVPGQQGVDVGVGLDGRRRQSRNASEPRPIWRATGLQRAVDQHPRRALRPAEHLADLARAHLLHEAQHQRLAPLGGQLARCAARPGAAARDRAPLPGRHPSTGNSSASSSGDSGWRRTRRRSFESALRAIWKSQTRKLLPGASACSRKSAGRERAQEDLRGQVLGGVRVAELVEREAVHLGDVLPIERLEGARIAPGRLYGGAVGVEVDQDRLVRSFPLLNTAEV